jgi:hypothetical protein
MDEKTERLRDVFLEVADEDTVTESKAPARGSLLDAPDDADVEERLDGVIDAVGERYGFSTDLGRGPLRRLVVAFHDGDDDAAIAEAVDADPETVARARLDLHLVRESDLAPPADPDAIRERLDEGGSVAAAAADLGVDPAALERYRLALRARDRARRANERYRDAFREALSDADLSTRLAAGAREDGLREATEDVETDVQF